MAASKVTAWLPVCVQLMEPFLKHLKSDSDDLRQQNEAVVGHFHGHPEATIQALRTLAADPEVTILATT